VTEPVIIDAVRSPFGKRGGGLKDIHPAMLGGRVLAELLLRNDLDAAVVDHVVYGCVGQIGEQGGNVGRTAWLAAGLPLETAATTIDLQCASSQQAVHWAHEMIASGAAEVVVAGGVESMSRIAMGLNVDGPGEQFPPELLQRYAVPHQGISAELVGRKYGVSRQAMDELGVESHRRAAHARASGWLSSQIVPIATDAGTVAEDEGIRAGATYEKAAQLKPAFDPQHAITAANASQLSDGATAVLLMSHEAAQRLGVRPRARIVAHTVVGCDPVLMLEGPIPATRAVLAGGKVGLEEIDLFEINEAFASIVLAWQADTGVTSERVNVNGGAIAFGHPTGASGARLLMSLLYELERRGDRLGLQAMCAGGGIGTATVIERLGDG
jgi:acetyl-CoA C-acetyltransferase/acetyl-CoA acyltransferase